MVISQSVPHMVLAAAIICLVRSAENSALYMYSPLCFITAPPLAIRMSGRNSSMNDTAIPSPLEVDTPIIMPFSLHLPRACSVLSVILLSLESNVPSKSNKSSLHLSILCVFPPITDFFMPLLYQTAGDVTMEFI